MKSRIAFLVISTLAILTVITPAATSAERNPDGLPNLRLVGWGFGVNCTQFGSVFAQVTNNGVDASPRFLVSIQIDGVYIGRLGTQSELPPGETVDLGPTLWRTMQFEPGEQHIVTFTVDPRGEIEETSEADNAGSTDFAC